jgi:CRISPR-associated protein Csc3
LSELDELRNLATLAATEHILGRSFKRSSILTPFVQMIEALERWPKPEDRGYLRAMLKDEVSTHIERASPYHLSAKRRQAIYLFVDQFFDHILNQEHHGNAQYLLERARLLKGAYLIFFREALSGREQEAVDEQEESTLEELGAIAEG